MKKTAKQNTQNKKKTISRAKGEKIFKIATWVTGAVALVALVSIITFTILADAGTIMRARTVKKSDDLSVNGAMFTYIFWDNFQNAISGDYASYYKLQGITSPDDLSLDNPYEEGKTWRDHFLDMAEETTGLMLSYGQYALDNGKGISAEDQKLIDEEIENIKDTAVIYGLSLEDYLARYFGRGVKEGDVRDVLELLCLSNNGIASMETALDPTEDELNTFYNTNTNELKKADYLFFVLGNSGKDNLTPEQEKYFSEKAEEISKSSSAAEFTEKVTAYLKEYNASLEAGDENKLNDNELEEYIENELESMKYMNNVYADELDVDKWIFSDSRVTGDTYVNHQDGYGTYGVVYIIKPVYIDSKWKEIAKDKILTTKIDSLIKELDEKYPVKLNKLTKVVAKLVD